MLPFVTVLYAAAHKDVLQSQKLIFFKTLHCGPPWSLNSSM